jgi:hypothetical protein
MPEMERMEEMEGMEEMVLPRKDMALLLEVSRITRIKVEVLIRITRATA